MNTLRHGKIARLPKPIREELNERLDQGAGTDELLLWLNGLPEVRAMLAARFAGRPIAAQNLSQWRRGGFQTWLHYRQAEKMANDFARETVHGEQPDRQHVTDMLAFWMAASFSGHITRVDELEGDEQLRCLHFLNRDLAMLRRDNCASMRMDLDREALALRQSRARVAERLATAREQARKRPRTNRPKAKQTMVTPQVASHPAAPTPTFSRDRETACAPAASPAPNTQRCQPSGTAKPAVGLNDDIVAGIIAAAVARACAKPTAETPPRQIAENPQTAITSPPERTATDSPSRGPKEDSFTNHPADQGAIPAQARVLPTPATPPHPDAIGELKRVREHLAQKLAKAQLTALREAANSGELDELDDEAFAARIKEINHETMQKTFANVDLSPEFKRALTQMYGEHIPEPPPSSTAFNSADEDPRTAKVA